MAKYCRNCGTELNPSWKLCPNCGVIIDSSVTQTPPLLQKSATISPQPTYIRTYSGFSENSYGIISLIFSLIGTIPILYHGFFVWVIAIITGAMGLKRDNNTVFATVGLILGILECVYFIMFVPRFYYWFWY
jgi:hypothetical protein